MIDFAELVSEQLFVEAATVTTDSSFKVFYEDSSPGPKLNALKDFFKNTFDIQTWPAYDKVAPILSDVFSRQRAESLIPFAEYYPVLDFVWYIVTNNSVASNNPNVLDATKISNLKHAEIEKLSEEFLNLCKQDNNMGPGSNPVFGYSAVSSKGIQLLGPLQRKLAQSIIGELVLTSPEFENLSIRTALYKLLEIRKKVRQSTLRNNVPSAIKELDNLLTDPRKEVVNEFPQKFKGVYDRVSAQTLYEISIAIERFFQSEISRFSIANPKTTIVNFITNEPLDNNKFIFVDGTTNKLADPLPGEGGYTLKNIRKINSTQAKDLIKDLESFANYIKEGEPSNLAATLGGVAGALKSFSGALGPTMGKR